MLLVFAGLLLEGSAPRLPIESSVSRKPASMGILVASRDPQAVQAIGEAADRLGLSVRLLGSGGELAEEAASGQEVLLLVMDMDVSPTAAFELCHRVRTGGDAPLVAVGTPTDRTTVVRALRAGADYYLPKPLDPELLAAHLEAALRRRPPVSTESDAVTVRDLTVDTDRKEVKLRGEVVPLTRAEYRLLVCLARNLGKVTSCPELVREISGYECSEQEAQQIVKVHVSRLRNKIDRDPSQPSYITNVRGFGYLLERRGP